jgi:AcrR family transcriptional regulator/DNA-binding MarR family transcriptional regulator
VGAPRRRGGVLVSQTQRSRMLSSAVRALAEGGYGELSVARITGGAGVSRRTFYDLFEDREDCFLAAFEDAAVRAREAMLAGYATERGWLAQARAGLFGLLSFMDREPGLRGLLVMDALKAGPRVLGRRAEILHELSAALHAGGTRARRGSELPALTGEGVTGAVLGVIHTRLLAEDPGLMVELLNPLMGVIVLPYLGSAAAQKELSRPAPKAPVSAPDTAAAAETAGGRPRDELAGFPMRITYRTLLALRVIGERPGVSNREVADQAGIADQGQISKLLARLEGLGLIENTGPTQPAGEPNQWRLTSKGQQVGQAIQSETDAGQRNGQSRHAARSTYSTLEETT